MDSQHPDEPTDRALRAMTVIAALRTALQVRGAIADRRAGRDPADQEPEEAVRGYLSVAVGDLHGLLARLRVALVVAQAEAEPEAAAALVHAFEVRLALSQLARDLHVLHQKLLSLYPAIAAALVEDTRQAHRAAAHLLDTDGALAPATLLPLLDRVHALLHALEETL